MSFGLQLGSYKQLKDAISFLEEKPRRDQIPAARTVPGIDYCAFAIDPDGFAFQLYYYMEQNRAGTANRGPNRSARKSTTPNGRSRSRGTAIRSWGNRSWGQWVAWIR